MVFLDSQHYIIICHSQDHVPSKAAKLQNLRYVIIHVVIFINDFSWSCAIQRLYYLNKEDCMLFEWKTMYVASWSYLLSLAEDAVPNSFPVNGSIFLW